MKYDSTMGAVMKRLIPLLLMVCLLLCACGPSVVASADTNAAVGRDTGKTTEAATTESSETLYSEDTPTICVDPGHGFEDIGTDSEYLGAISEKDITLSIALYLAADLTSRGFQVILTHDGTAIPASSIDDGNRLFNPQERIAYVSDYPTIDYYISIHCDSYSADESVNGMRIYYSADTDYSRTSSRITKTVADAIDMVLPESKSVLVKEMPFENAYYVIRSAACPSSLIEVGFVTNPGDAEKMLDDSWRLSVAKGIADGISEFFAD